MIGDGCEHLSQLGLAGYSFIHTLAGHCYQINNALSISIHTRKYIHMYASHGSTNWSYSITLQVHELDPKHFLAFLSLSVLYTMACA